MVNAGAGAGKVISDNGNLSELTEEESVTDVKNERNPMSAHEKAVAMIAAVEGALARGVRHSQNGRPLTTAHEVITAMLNGPVELKAPRPGSKPDQET